VKIKEIRVKVYRAGLEIPDFGSANDMVLVKVIGEDGTEGIGYVTDYHHIKEGVYFSDLLASFIERVVSKFVVGRDTTEYEAMWDEVFQRTTRWGRRGFVIHALSGVDIAILDLFS
jgi:L-alanine-DL-glutamate epimerase and related enzymes of enolase superfamily